MSKLLVLAAYLGLLALISLQARRRTGKTPEEYFLAGRSLGPVVLFLSMAATNFSAFFFLGFAGAAWRTGLSQYGIMGLGTALVPVSFYFIGRAVWRLGKRKGYLTAPELIGGEFASPALRWVVLLVMVTFTIPYLLTQAAGAGIIISSLLGVDVLRLAGSITILAIGVVVVLGGMRGTAWTDVLQGTVMIIAMLAAVIFVADGMGGFSEAGRRAFSVAPEHFSRPGPGNAFSVAGWTSFLILWTFVNPMFPQLFTRFYTARSHRSLKAMVWLYPLLVSFLFLAPVLIGVWARGSGLEFSAPDAVLPSMVAHFTPGWVHLLVMTGALAALMSTADSQLLALATMLANDLGIQKDSVRRGRLLAAVLCMLVALLLMVGFNPQTGIFTLLTQTTFAGLAALTPAALAALYASWIPRYAPLASIFAGEAAVILMRLGWLPTFGLADGVVALASAGLVLGLAAMPAAVKKMRELQRKGPLFTN